MLRRIVSNRKLLKSIKESALEDTKQISRIESCKWISKECCLWMIDRENGCYHTECGYDYSFNDNGRGGFCMYCGRLIAVPSFEEDGECLSFSN